MAWKENMTQEEYNTDITAEAKKAKEGLFTKEYVDGEIVKTKDLFKDHISKEDFEKSKTTYETTIKELEKFKPKDKTEAEKQLEQTQKENRKLKFREKLLEQGLPRELSDFMSISDDETKDKEVFENLKGLFDSYKDGEKYFNPTKHKKNEGMTKEKFNSMSTTERFKLFQENPEMYQKLSGE